MSTTKCIATFVVGCALALSGCGHSFGSVEELPEQGHRLCEQRWNAEVAGRPFAPGDILPADVLVIRGSGGCAVIIPSTPGTPRVFPVSGASELIGGEPDEAGFPPNGCLRNSHQEDRSSPKVRSVVLSVGHPC